MNGVEFIINLYKDANETSIINSTELSFLSILLLRYKGSRKQSYTVLLSLWFLPAWHSFIYLFIY